MFLLIVIITACLLLAIKSKVSNVEDAKKYLMQYEYIGNDSFGEYETAIMGIQEKYNLFVDVLKERPVLGI